MNIVTHNNTRLVTPNLERSSLVKAVRKSLKLPPNTTFNLVYVSSSKMRSLNKEARNKDKATDVLSFPLHSKKPYLADPDGVVRLGDIYISLPTAKQQAEERKISLQREVRELAVHGLLHLTGYHHDTSKSAAAMQKKSDQILSDLYC